MTPRKKPKPTVYERVKRAALDDCGCQLSATDCYALYMLDDAFRRRADMDELNQTSLDDPRPFKGDAP